MEFKPVFKPESTSTPKSSRFQKIRSNDLIESQANKNESIASRTRCQRIKRLLVPIGSQIDTKIEHKELNESIASRTRSQTTQRSQSSNLIVSNPKIEKKSNIRTVSKLSNIVKNLKSKNGSLIKSNIDKDNRIRYLESEVIKSNADKDYRIRYLEGEVDNYREFMDKLYEDL